MIFSMCTHGQPVLLIFMVLSIYEFRDFSTEASGENSPLD